MYKLLPLSCAVCVLSALSTVGMAQQPFPVRPVRLITPYEPGGSTTIVSRLMGAKLTEIWGQSVIVDNRPGGNTVIGTQAAVRANPDGYTLLFATTTFAINHLTVRSLPYDSLKDLAPLANIYYNETILAIHPSIPANTLAELIAYAKSRPGGLNNGASGIGGFAQIRSEMFRILTGADIKNISYKGTGPAVTALLGGHVQLAFVPPIATVPYINSGKLKGLAVTGTQRVRALPQVPTFAEAGLPAYNASSWNGVLVPASTSRPLIQRISNDIAKVLSAPELREKMSSQGAEPGYAGPEEFAKMIKDDIARYARVIKEANIQMAN